MKKQLAIILAILLIASVVFVACDNATPEHQHIWSEDWSGNAEQHWHDCTAEDCSEKNDLGNHTDPDNTGVCSVCGRTLSTEPTPQPQDSVTLYFYNAEGWQNVYAYTYNVADEKLLGAWPGTQTTQDSREGWVKIEVEANPATDAFNIIFNDGVSNQATDLVIDDAQNVYLINKAEGTYASYAEAETAASQKPAQKDTATINFHKNEDWGAEIKFHPYANQEALMGDWGTNTATAGENGWYTITISVVQGKLNAGDNYNVIIYDSAKDSNRVEVVVQFGNELWIAQDGHVFSSKAEVEQYEALDKEEYTIYYYAPDWPTGQAVYIYTYNGTLGSIGNYSDITMQAVADKTGWYSVDVETAVEVKSFSVIFHAENDNVNDGGIKHEFYVENLTGNAFYFIANGNNAYATEAEAVTAYNANKALADTDEINLVFHLYAPDWAEVGIHTWNGYATGDWGTVTMTADAENTGWWTYSFKMREGELTGKGINVIFFDKINDTQDTPVRITTYTNDASYIYFNANKGNDNKFTSMAEALATEGDSGNTPGEGGEEGNTPDPETTTMTMHLYAPDWAEVGIHTWNGYVTGDWGTVTMTADAENTGWWIYTFEVETSRLANPGINVIFFDKINDTQDTPVRITTYTNDASYIYFNANKGNDNKFTSMADALAH